MEAHYVALNALRARSNDDRRAAPRPLRWRSADPRRDGAVGLRRSSAAHGPPRRSGARWASAAFLNRLAALMRPRSASETARPEAESHGLSNRHHNRNRNQ